MPRRSLATCCCALLLSACMPEETCPERQPNREPASTPSAWVEVTAPRDVSLLQAAARVVLPGDRQAVIRPLFRARIARFHVQVGDRVRAGQPIVDVVMPEVLTAAADYRGAVLRGAAQTARRDKLRGLRGEGLVAERDVFEIATRAAEVEQQALTAAATLRAAGLDPARARELLQQPEVTLTSAIDGVVRELNGRLGEVLEGQGPPVAAIVGEGRPRVEARFLHAPPAGATMRFHAVDGGVWPLAPEPLARTVEADDGAVVMWFQAEGERLAAPGLRGTVEAFSDEPGVVQVPAGALSRQGADLVVYRRRDGQVTAVAVELLMASGASALVRPLAPAAEAVPGDMPAKTSPEQPAPAPDDMSPGTSAPRPAHAAGAAPSDMSPGTSATRPAHAAGAAPGDMSPGTSSAPAHPRAPGDMSPGTSASALVPGDRVAEDALAHERAARAEAGA